MGRTRELYLKFIHRVRRDGLPVKFLSVVGDNVYFIPNFCENGEGVLCVKTNYANNRLGLLGIHTMHLSDDTLGEIENIKIGMKYSREGGIDTIFHEATHIYMGLSVNRKKYSKIIKRGINYYRNAPMKGNRKAEDPEVLFEEAIGEYVGQRASIWWETLSSLVRYSTSNNYSTIIKRKMLFYHMKNYNSKINNDFLGTEKEVTTTLRRFPNFLKKFLDREILEGKIPDSFDEVEVFKPYVNKILMKR